MTETLPDYDADEQTIPGDELDDLGEPDEETRTVPDIPEGDDPEDL